MKRLVYLFIAALLITAIPSVVCAQTNDDPFEQQTLKSNDNNSSRERKVSRRKNTDTEVKQVKQEPAPTPKPVEVIKEEVIEKVVESDIIISNPCSDWLDLEFISLIGSRGTQTAKITCKITNHDENKSMVCGGRVVAYDTEGDEHYSAYAGSSYTAYTDIPLKFSFEIPGKMVPSKVEKFNVITFSVGDCRIEMRNVPIEWK